MASGPVDQEMFGWDEESGDHGVKVAAWLLIGSVMAIVFVLLLQYLF